MRRSLTLLATVAILIGLVAAPAAADRPTEFPYLDEFEDFDPCTGLPMDVTLEGTRFVHEHKNNLVDRLGERTGFTTSGYVLVGGHDNLRMNKNGFIVSFKEVWRNPVNGDKMQTTMRLRIVGNAPVVDSLDQRCVGGPTPLLTP